jgi:hypothetical protein
MLSFANCNDLCSHSTLRLFLSPPSPSPSHPQTNNALEGYNFRLFTRFGLHPSIWEFIHYLKDEETLVSHRITHLGGGSGITSSTLIYSTMQSKRKAKKNQRHLSNLEELFDSGLIGIKEYLTSAFFLVGQMSGQNYGNDEVADEVELLTD